MMKKVFGGSKKKNNNNTAAAAGGGAAPAVVPAPAVDAANIPKMAKHVDLPKEESDETKVALLDVFLSPASCTEVHDKKQGADDAELTVLQPNEITDLLKRYVDGVEEMYDRTGNLALPQMFVLTYTNGLPLYANNAAVQQHTIRALRTIFNEVAFGDRPEPAKRKWLTRLCDGFRACQAEQGRVIDAVYGIVTGRERSIRDQVLSVVDVQKDLVLENLVNKFHPDAWKQGDDIPQKQIPHINSSYRLAIGQALGLRGMQGAQMDHCRFNVPDSDARVLQDAFRRMFSIDELCSTLVHDVNQQQADADRLIDRDALARWAGSEDENNGFESHSIFYDEDTPDAYKDLGKPVPENMYQPFLTPKVALNILKALFLQTNKKPKK